MAYVITHGCCTDTSCIPVCPVQCIRPLPGDPDFGSTDQLYIDPKTCIDCGACMDVCPVNAIHSDLDLPEQLAEYRDVNAAYFATSQLVQASPGDCVPRRLPAERPELAVAVVGTGPAGCYAVAELAEIPGVRVSVFDRLPTPFGLVRSGVAPDHPNTKLIAKRFGGALSRSNVSCFFNVEIGRDVSIEELLHYHHAVVWAGGAADDRRLGIPGEELPGCVSAREFVAWYNGHPDAADFDFTLDGPRVVVIGNGNVGLDVARILATPLDGLERTDIADHSLAALRASAIEEVVLTARRGPESAAYTAGELSALGHQPGIVVRTVCDEVAGVVNLEDRRSVIVTEAAGRPPTAGLRTITLRYGLLPVSINRQNSVESVTFERADGTLETISTGLVIRAIGSRGKPVAGLPFNDESGTLPHAAGRVLDPVTAQPIRGVYCAGWIKRGATGTIGTNRTDAAETLDAIVDDLFAGRLVEPKADVNDLGRLVSSRRTDVVDDIGWRRIDLLERSRGRAAGRPRSKIVHLPDLLAAARADA
jgi:ferredoxin--NADP+ reductase